MYRRLSVLVLLAGVLVAVPGAQQPDTLDYGAIGCACSKVPSS